MDNFVSSWQEITQDVITSLEPLPKIHAHHHRRASSETTHQLYREQMKTDAQDHNALNEGDNDQEWIILREAVSEKDIMNLRESLRQIGSSNVSHNYFSDDIERYLEGEMSSEELEMFDGELAVNPQLNRDIEMHVEVEEAVAETDIISLRESLGHIMSRQSSTARNLEEIDAFLENELAEDDNASFFEEMANDKDLKAEVNLIRELNASLGEKDIIQLRGELEQISKDAFRQESKSILPVNRLPRKFRIAGIAAAVLVLLLGVSPVMKYMSESGITPYEQFYDQPSSLSAFRSADADAVNLMSKGFDLYNQGDYNKALLVFHDVLKINENMPSARFYSGASYQGISQFSNAIIEYDKVIEQNNNLFVEQAEWYRALCYLGLDDRDNASSSLYAIMEKKGFYKEKAQRVLARLNREKE
jgi:tetratricopeptide (TPR) repeat protein